jgi:hypothetical protein
MDYDCTHCHVTFKNVLVEFSLQLILSSSYWFVAVNYWMVVMPLLL